MKPYALTQHDSESIYSLFKLWNFQLGRDGRSEYSYRLTAAAGSLKRNRPCRLRHRFWNMIYL